MMKKLTVAALSTCLFMAIAASAAGAAPVTDGHHHKAAHHAKKMHAKKMHAKAKKIKAKSIKAKAIKPKALPKTGFGGASE